MNIVIPVLASKKQEEIKAAPVLTRLLHSLGHWHSLNWVNGWRRWGIVYENVVMTMLVGRISCGNGMSWADAVYGILKKGSRAIFVWYLTLPHGFWTEDSGSINQSISPLVYFQPFFGKRRLILYHKGENR